MSKIVVRLPNWLGDMVMSTGFINQLPYFFPGCEISVIVKKGLQDLLHFFPPLKHTFIFNKEEYHGSAGLLRFGNRIKNTEKFDCFVSLPNSFSSALMGFPIAPVRIGYKKELRQMFLTHSYAEPKELHRVEEYIRLIELYTRKPATDIDVRLKSNERKQDYIVVNINSEASSRRLTQTKAIELLNSLAQKIDHKIILIGSSGEKEFVEDVLKKLDVPDRFESMAGKTSLLELAKLLASASIVLSTDSGPAHLSNSLGTYTIVLFGAGNEFHTSPYLSSQRSIIRLGKLVCEPCEKNICMRFPTPQCLEQLNCDRIVDLVKHKLSV